MISSIFTRTTAIIAGVLALVLGAAVSPPVASAQAIAVSSDLPTSMAATLQASYSVPSGAIFVATTGSDSNTGTQASPYKTLYKAMSSVAAGGTIVVRGGVYRQGASATTGYNLGGTYYFVNMKAGVTVQSYPGETVWFDGSEQVTSWTKAGTNHYTTSWSTPDFCAQKYYSVKLTAQSNSGPCAYPDAIGTGASVGDPQMVYRNGTQLRQVATLAEMTSADTFYYDWANRTIHIAFDPAGSTVELTKYAQAMALYKPTNFSLKGIGFRRYGSNNYGNATGGAILLNSGSNVLLERVVITQSGAQGLISWQTAHLTIRKSMLSENGGNGMGLDGAWSARNGGSTPADDLVLEYSRFDGNNADRFGVNCTSSCTAAGVKVTGAMNITLRYDSFSRNGGGRGSGFWCDLNCNNLVAYGNVFEDNDRHGLIYEISDKAIIASNLFVNNGWDSAAYGGGYAMYVGSANARIYNNTLVDNKNGVGIYDDSRSPTSNTGGFSALRIGPNSVGNQFVNNIVAGGDAGSGRQVAVMGGDASYSGNTAASKVVSLMANNSYFTGGAKYWFAWVPNTGKATQIYSTVASVQSGLGLESSSQLSTASANPYLTKPASGDYSVLAGSQADGTARALPSDIAALLSGNTNGADRGVISLGGGSVSSAGTGAGTGTGTGGGSGTSTQVVKADFAQAVSSGWGTATTGGEWTTAGAGFSVAGGVGLLSLGASSTRTASLASVSATNVDATVQLALDKLLTGGKAQVSLDLRKGTDGAYRVRASVNPDGSVTLLLIKVVGTSETALAATRTVSGYTYAAGKSLKLRFEASGNGTTSTVHAKAWDASASEPTDWLVTATDTQATLQDAGSVGLVAYVEGTVTNAPVVLSVDNLAVTKTS